MKWIKSTWAVLLAAAVVFLAIFAAGRHKAASRKWQETAVGIEEGTVKKGTMTAEAASTRAKLHDARADEIKAKAEAKVGQKDKSTAELMKQWGVKKPRTKKVRG